jgi:sugar phosphate isomerase/epimerase
MNKITLAPTSLASTEPLEFIDAAARAGFDGIGLRLYRSPGINYAFYPIAGDKDMEAKVTDALRAGNLEVIDVLSFYLQPEMDFESMMTPLAFGAEIGATYALVIGDDPEWDRMVQNFGRFCDLAKGFGLKASIEAPVTQRVVNKLSMALGLIRESGRDNAVVCIDPYHFHRTGHTVEDIRREPAALFPYTQIDDGTEDERPPAGRCAIGEGVVPLAAMFDVMTPELPLSLEWGPPRNSGYSAAEWAKIAYDKTRAFMEGYYASKAASR